MQEQKDCKHCHTPFFKNTTHQLFCSEDCCLKFYNDRRKPEDAVQCPSCKGPMARLSSRCVVCFKKERGKKRSRRIPLPYSPRRTETYEEADYAPFRYK